ACGVDGGNGCGKEVAVNVGTEARRRWRGFGHGGFDEIVGGELAQVGELGGAEGGLDEVDVALLEGLPRWVAKACAVQGSAALADGLGDEASALRRGHEGAD